MTIRTALLGAIHSFEKAGIQTAPLDAEVLCAHALCADRAYVLAHGEHELSKEQEQTFLSYVTKREQRVPIAYIVGEKEFFGFSFFVNHHTLIPRPETEMLVEQVIEYCTKHPRVNSLLEMGTGSGCIIISALKHTHSIARAIAVDISKGALEIAQKNAERHGMKEGIDFIQSDMWQNVFRLEKVDMIIANLPYLSKAECEDAKTNYPEITYEPQSALLGGENGLDCFQQFFEGAQMHLKKGGVIFLEIGTHQQHALSRLTKKYLPEADCNFILDECNNPRIAIVSLNEKVHHPVLQ